MTEVVAVSCFPARLTFHQLHPIHHVVHECGGTVEHGWLCVVVCMFLPRAKVKRFDAHVPIKNRLGRPVRRCRCFFHSRRHFLHQRTSSIDTGGVALEPSARNPVKINAVCVGPVDHDHERW
jgi:hypothetical protein